MATAAEEARWKWKPTIADAAGRCCSQATTKAMDLLQGPSTPSPRPRSCLAFWRFESASAGRGEDDDRDLQEAQARPCWGRRRPAQDQQELSASPVPWMVTTGTPRSSSTARSSAPTTMIPHRTRSTLSLCFSFLSK